MNYPLLYYTDSDQGSLIFHLLDVGEGLMCLIIFPNQVTMLFDCNVTDDNQKQVLNYLGQQIPSRVAEDTEDKMQWIDVFVNSHRDDDHYRGLSTVHSKFPIKSIWDSGQTGATTQSSDYQYYMQLRRTLREQYGENAVIVPAPSRLPLRNISNAEVYCLNSSLDYSNQANYLTFARLKELVESRVLREGKAQHTNSIALSIKYGDRILLLPGDSDYLAWRDKIMPNFENTGLLKTNILVASHHGSRSFFTDEAQNDNINLEENPESTYIDHIHEIEPSITIIPCGVYDSAHHPNKEALNIYKENSANGQVYTTHEKGSFAGFVGANGYWTVVPSRMYPRTSINNNFKLKCMCNYKGTEYEGRSGGEYKIGSSLRFSIHSTFGILEPINQVQVWWEVSNGGINSHHEHQDIYYKGKNKNTPKHVFHRDVSYQGRHLLRCRIQNRKRKIYATQVFVVNGVTP